MKKDLIFEELERMREIMGVKNSFKKRVSVSKMLNETTLLFEGGPGGKGDPESIIKALSGERIVDELTTAQVRYIDNFEAALQRNLAGTEVETMDDLIKSMEKHYADMGKLGADGLTPDQILGYIKKRPQLAQSFEEAILKSTTELFEKRVANYGVKDILKAADMEYLYDDIMELSNQTINSTTRESVQELVNAQRKMLNDLKNSGKLTDNQKIAIEELEEHLNTVESRIKTDRENSKIYDGLKEEPINPKQDPDILAPIPADVADEISDEVAEEVFRDPKKTIKEKFEVLRKNKKLRNKEGVSIDDIDAIEDELLKKYGNMTGEQFEKNIEVLEKDIETLKNRAKTKNEELKRKAAEDEKNKPGYLQAISENEGIMKALNLIYDNKLTRFCVGKDTKGVEPTVDFKWYSPFKMVGCLTILSLGTALIHHFNTPPLERKPLAGIPCRGISTLGLCDYFYGNHGWCKGECTGEGNDIIPNLPKFYENNLDGSRGFKKWCEEHGHDKDKCGGKDGNYYYEDSNGNKQAMEFKKDDFVKSSKSSTSYDNSPAGYKKFIEDNSKTYGNAGGYVYQGGIPLYKDGTGKWQAGEYKDGTFVIPGLK